MAEPASIFFRFYRRSRRGVHGDVFVVYIVQSTLLWRVISGNELAQLLVLSAGCTNYDCEFRACDGLPTRVARPNGNCGTSAIGSALRAHTPHRHRSQLATPVLHLTLLTFYLPCYEALLVALNPFFLPFFSQRDDLLRLHKRARDAIPRLRYCHWRAASYNYGFEVLFAYPGCAAYLAVWAVLEVCGLAGTLLWEERDKWMRGDSKRRRRRRGKDADIWPNS